MAKIPKKLQLELLAEFQFLPDNLDHLDSKAFGVIEREGKKLYRYRASDYRIYFARTAEGILVHRSCTRTRSAISYSDRNCPWLKTNS